MIIILFLALPMLVAIIATAIVLPIVLNSKKDKQVKSNIDLE